MDRSEATSALGTALKSQYHAALAMLRQAIERCPDDLWTSREYRNPFWRIAYHALYYTHLYSRPTAADFRPHDMHQTSIQDLDDMPSPPEIMDLVELPHRPPQTGEPYAKAQVLAYWDWCERMIDDAVDALDLLAPESGFSWYKISKLEHQIVSIRHLQHHAAQLGDRVRFAVDVPLDWAGARGRRR
jgi:hypothetical protein